MSHANRTEYRCPSCGDSSVAQTLCERCGVDMIDPSPDARRGPHARRYAAGQWVAGGAVLGSLLGTQVGEYLVALTGESNMFLGGMVACAVAGAAASRAAGRLSAKAARTRLARRAFARTELRAVRDAGEGRVRVAGVATALRAVRDARGLECLAYECRGSEGPEAMLVRAEGGDFALDDGSGARVVVRAEFVMVVGAGDLAGGATIPVGARVEVVGVARWAADSGEGPGGGMRRASRVLELVGTPNDPIVIRLAPAPAPAAPRTTTGVRVALNPALAPPADARDAHAEPAAAPPHAVRRGD